jgi:hypothetical protein
MESQPISASAFSEIVNVDRTKTIGMQLKRIIT